MSESNLRTKANPNYKQRIESRKERYEELAVKNEKLSDEQFDSAKKMASVIPFGQPILVDHYSEKRDRRYRQRIENKFNQSVETQRKADYYENKAKSVGRSGIQSDDPEAIIKLKEKILRLENNLKQTKAVNKIIRKKQFSKFYDGTMSIEEVGEFKDELLKVVSEKFASSILTMPVYSRRCGLNTTYDATKLRDAKKRLKYFEEEEKRELIKFEINEIEVKEEDGYIKVFFPDKPNKVTREKLGKYGIALKWSRFEQCWKRKKTQNVGQYFLNNLKEILKTAEY